MIQLTLTLKMTTVQVVEMSVTVNRGPIQDYVHPDDETQPTFEIYIVVIQLKYYSPQYTLQSPFLQFPFFCSL